MSTELDETPRTTDSGSDSELAHIVCCIDYTAALCGHDCTNEAIDMGHDPECVVCHDLEDNAQEFCPIRPRCINA